MVKLNWNHFDETQYKREFNKSNHVQGIKLVNWLKTFYKGIAVCISITESEFQIKFLFFNC